MENILQSLVKIIIIGALYGKTNVDCNRQFLASPPLPYYQNEDYYVPGFAPAFSEQLPLYYPERKAPPPVSYQNANSYSPPQLFYQNENYVPPSYSNPGLRYPSSQVLPFKQNFQPSSKPQQRLNFGYARVEYKKSPQRRPTRPQEVSHKKTEAFASNIIVRDEPLTPYYHDDYKNYNDEDYADTYSDETPTPPKPCTPTNPYRYFQSPQTTPNTDDKFTLCNPYFQPNFGNSVYTVKMPITLLPSRFPPRVEQLIERIQNYFSTYTQQQTPNPQNETFPPSTPQTPVETSSESAAQLSVTEEVSSLNNTGENEQETTTEGAAVGDSGQVTQKTIVVEIEANEAEDSSTTAPDARPESQVEEGKTQTADDGAKIIPEAITGNVQAIVDATAGQVPPTSSEGQSLRELTQSGDGKAGNEEQKPRMAVLESSTPAEGAPKVNESSNDHTNGSFHDVTSNNG